MKLLCTRFESENKVCFGGKKIAVYRLCNVLHSKTGRVILMKLDFMGAYFADILGGIYILFSSQ